MQTSRATILSAGLLVAAALAPSVARPQDESPDPRALRRTPVVEVFEKCRDSVVFVTGPRVPAGEKAKLAEFFNVPIEKPEKSVGTGFLVHESGYVLTNAHGVDRVIANEVVLADGKKYPAELIASIRNEDLALLKIDAGRPLPAVRLAPSGDLLIGETVIVIGNPHGLMSTCTTGVVSALGRQTNLLDVQGVTLREMIQTDAGINPGSSGGPWFNVLGEVIGLTASMKRDAQNIGFALPAASLRRLLPGMLDAERRYGLVTGLTLADSGACRVTGVEPNSPAAGAGIRDGDLLVKLAETPVPTAADFHLALVARKPGQTLAVDLVRDDQPVTLALILAARPKPDAAALLRDKFGLSAQPVDDEKVKSMALRDRRGFVITEVHPGYYENVTHPPAAGDVLARVNRIRPRDFDHLALILEKIEPGQQMPMVILRHRGSVSTRIDVNFVVPR